MSQLQNKNVHQLKNIGHIAVHFPLGTSKVCNKIAMMYKIKYLLKRVHKIIIIIVIIIIERVQTSVWS